MSDGAGLPRFRMGRLDHVHIRVPDRAEAADWYARILGFEAVEAYEFWATGVEGGPLQISADGGQTMLALFETSEFHPMIAQQTGVAFSIDAIINDARTSTVPEIKGLGRTLKQWRTPILASHSTGASNGPTEGLNSIIKKIKRVAAGFTNFAHNRTRILLAIGGCDWTLIAPQPR